MSLLRAGIVAALSLVVGPVEVPRPPEGTQCAGPTPARCHEPAGFIRFAENAGVLKYPNEADTSAFADSTTVGAWGFEPRRGFGVVPEPDAPESPPRVIRSTFPERFQSGRGPVTWWGWDSAGAYDGQKSKMYLSLWLRIEGRDYENQAVGTKMGFIGYGGDPDRVARNEGFFLLKGTGRQAIGSQFPLQFLQQGHIDRTLSPNRRGRQIVVGKWQHWEVLFALNDMGRANGVFRLWIDGELTSDYTNVVYITPRAPNGFHGYHWNPTWGGMGGVRTRRDVMLIDHVYMSGLPYTAPVRRARD